jgi:hypothetical protein
MALSKHQPQLFDLLEDVRSRVKGYSTREKAVVLIEYLTARVDIVSE